VSDSVLSREIGDAGALLGLVLAIVTLFTSEQARRLEAELAKPSFDRARQREIRWVTSGVLVATAAAIFGLAPLARQAISTSGGNEIEPVLWIFVITWFLLGGLLIWQASIVARCASTVNERSARMRWLVGGATALVGLGDLAIIIWGLV
jgi:hypothetical protein